MNRPPSILFPAAAAAALLISPFAGASDPSDLAKKSQNPVSDLISVPVQGNFNFGLPGDDAQFINLIQPVVPQSLNDDWNWIHRGIIPVPMYQPGIDSTWGLGDIQYEGFLSPANPGSLIWGVGPYLSFPTATGSVLGSEKFSAGPAVVLLTMPGNWVIGGLATHLWSYAGDSDRSDVNLTSFQYFLNYNIPDSGGWYLTSAPTMTFNWEAPSGERTTVPLGGGIGRVFKLGEQHLNAKAQFFGYADAPTGGPDWSFQFQLTFLFPQ